MYIRAILIFSILVSSFNATAQLDTIHWIPPLHAGLNGQIEDHYVYISTPVTIPFTITIKDGSGTVLATPIISNTSPFVYFVGNGQTSGSPLFVNRGSLNTVLSNRGLILSAAQPFFATIRARSNNQADWAVSKGSAGLGTTFRFGGFPQFNAGPTPSGSSASNRNFTMGIMATQNNTTITISDYDPALTLDGTPVFLAPPSFTITLNQGETYTIAGGNNFAPNQNGFIGALIQADKPIALNNGNLNGTVHPTNTFNQDMGFDLSIPIDRLGKEYVFIEGNGNQEMERPIIIAHQDTTEIFVNGSLTPLVSINAGDFFMIPNSSYQGTTHRNLFVRTSKPAYAYQALAATSNENDGGLVLLPPFTCFLPDSIDLISSVDSIGTIQYQSSMLITTELGAVVEVNGVPLSGAEPVMGSNWQTYKTGILAGNVKITSTGGVTASVLGVASPAGYAGYFSGFSNAPLPGDFTISDTCFGSATMFFGDIDTTVMPDSVTWNFGDPGSGNNNTENGNTVPHIFSSSGIYTVQMITHRCKNDTIEKTITINPSSIDTMVFTICQGTSITVGATTYNTTGVFIDTLTNIFGCDSLIMVDLTVNPELTTIQTFTECEGFSVTVGSNTYDTTGIYIDSLTTSTGCDSVVTTNLTIVIPNQTAQTFTECEGFSVTIGTNEYNTTGVFIDTLITSTGCDSVVTTNLTIVNSNYTTQTFTECEGFSVTVGSNTYDTTGVYIDSLTTSIGCDSIVMTNLTIVVPTHTTQTFTGCEGFSVDVESNTYNTTGIFIDTLTASTACDSIVITNLTIIIPTHTTQTFTECEGFSITVGNNEYNTTGIFVDIIGCDTITTDLTIHSVPELLFIKDDDNCSKNRGSITALTLTDNPPVTFNWNTGAMDSVLVNLPAGIYSVVVKDNKGCTNSGSIDIQDIIDNCEREIFIPNVFSPNGDQQNDFFWVRLTGYELISLQVYNRWGLLLFETNDINNGWNGRTNTGSIASDGTYFFILHYNDQEDKKIEKGTITLLR